MNTEAFEALAGEREKQIVQLTVEGLYPGEIGNRLSLSEKEVQEDLDGIFTRLGITSRFDLILYALTYGLPS